MLKDIEADNEERVNLYFDHGLDINIQFTAKEYQKRTPIHFAALHGSL